MAVTGFQPRRASVVPPLLDAASAYHRLLAKEERNTYTRVSIHEPRVRRTRPPHQVRLPGFVADDDIGLGDVVKRATLILEHGLWEAANAGRPH